MKRKIFSLFVLCMFLISATAISFAENEGQGESNAPAETEDDSSGDETPDVQPVTARQRVMAITQTGEVLAAKIRENQKNRLQQAVEKCNEQDDPEACKEKLRRRISLVDSLAEKDLQRINRIQAQRTEKIQNLIQLKAKNTFKKFSEEGFKARVIVQQKLAKARLDYVKAKEKYQETKNKYIQAKNKFLNMKGELNQCKGDDSEECEQNREMIRQHAKDNLLNIADLILKELDKIKNKIESSEDLSEEEASELLGSINEKITKVEEAKAVIENIDNESTKEEIQDAAKLLKREWVMTKYAARRAVGQLINSRIGGIIVKSKQLEIKLERVIERMVEQGKDTAAVEGLVDDFNAKLESARENYETAVEKYKEARLATENVGELIQEAHSYMKQAHTDLKDAHNILREIFQELKEQGVEDELDSVEDEIEEEIDEEETEEEEEETGEEEGGE